MAGNAGVGSYAAAGSGGHGPVKVVLGPPLARRVDRRPGVVVMDTGIGAHPWFDADAVRPQLLLDDQTPVGMDIVPGDPTDPEAAGATESPLTGL
jgi:hypothetical protein